LLVHKNNRRLLASGARNHSTIQHFFFFFFLLLLAKRSLAAMHTTFQTGQIFELEIRDSSLENVGIAGKISAMNRKRRKSWTPSTFFKKLKERRKKRNRDDNILCAR
jgi:hypothetical protein